MADLGLRQEERLRLCALAGEAIRNATLFEETMNQIKGLSSLSPEELSKLRAAILAISLMIVEEN